MQIPSTTSYQPPVRPTKAPSSGDAARSKASASTDDASETDAVSSDPITLNAYEPIQQAMNNLPDSRADVVARGKALAADPKYPALKIISNLANLFIGDAQASLVDEH